jgi:phage terminase large subunit
MIQLEINSKAFNPVYLPHLKNQHRYQIFFGGSSSGKSFFLAQRCVIDVFGGKRNYLVVRNVANTLRQSCFNEIVKAISSLKLKEYFSINNSDMVITCTLNQKQILFAGLDDPDKLKSKTPISGVITDIWVEEATEVSKDAVKQLNKRMRGRAEAKKRMTLSFNPVLRDHWIFVEYFSIWQDDKTYVESDTLSILKTTYLDNRFLAPEDIKDLEDETDKYYYEVYTLGNWGVLGAVIFRNWRVEDFSDIEGTFPLFHHGGDWGFGADPFAYVKLYFDKTRQRLYICDEVYACGLLNQDAADLIKPKCGGDIVTFDSAEPKSIAEIRLLGINAVGAKKGQGSVEFGIKLLQGLEIIIHPRCQNAKNEFSKYKWKEDKNGVALPIPLDKDNHCLTGDTIVNTVDGDYPISELVGKTGIVNCYDEVNQKRTIAKYHDCRLTQKDAEVFEITLEDGRTIKATREHPVFTQRGWVIVGNLKEDDCILDISNHA